MTPREHAKAALDDYEANNDKTLDEYVIEGCEASAASALERAAALFDADAAAHEADANSGTHSPTNLDRIGYEARQARLTSARIRSLKVTT